MKNAEIVQNLNFVYEFLKREKEAGQAKLNVTGQFRVQKVIDILTNAYKPYEISLNAIKNEKGSAFNQNGEDVEELLTADQDIDISSYMLKEENFRDGVTYSDIQLLKFMTN